MTALGKILVGRGFLAHDPALRDVIAVGAALVSIRSAYALGTAGRLLTWVWLGPIGAAAILMFAGFVNMLNDPRWLSASVAAQAMLLASGIAMPLGRWRAVRSVTGELLVAALILSVANYMSNSWYPTTREAAQFIE